MKTSELTGTALDWAVAKCDGLIDHLAYRPAQFVHTHRLGYDNYSTDWSKGGQIIEREQISTCWEGTTWVATLLDKNCGERWYGHQYGPTPLVAAMRCYCCSKLGEFVDIPEGLK